MASLTSWAVCGLTAWPSERGSVVAMTAPSGERMWSTRYGFITTPLLAMVAATTAFCMTVTCGPAGLSCSPTGWPHAAHAVSQSVISAGLGMSEMEVEKSCPSVVP